MIRKNSHAGYQNRLRVFLFQDAISTNLNKQVEKSGDTYTITVDVVLEDDITLKGYY